MPDACYGSCVVLRGLDCIRCVLPSGMPDSTADATENCEDILNTFLSEYQGVAAPAAIPSSSLQPADLAPCTGKLDEA